MIRQSTPFAKRGEVSRAWHVMDADGRVLGRLATRAAHLLRGKHKPLFTPHVDCGDGVIVINAEKIRLTGNKMETKTYQRYSGYPSGLKIEPARRLLVRRPTEMVRRAVTGMLPHNPLGRQVGRRLRVYAGPRHKHAAQVKTTGAKTS